MEIARIEVGRTTGTCTRRGRIPAGIVGASVQVSFTDPVWHNLIKTIVFRGKETRIAEFDGAAAVIPHEVVAEPGVTLYFGIFGHDPNSDLQIPLIEVRLGTTEAATDANADPGTDPTLPIWAQLQQEVEQLKQGSEGPETPVKPGADGGYYTPAVTQPEQNKIQFDFTPSKADMPAVKPVQVELPAGQGSGGNVAYDKEQELTDEQKERARENIGAQAAGNYLTEVPEGYAKTEDVEKVNGRVEKLGEVVSKFHSNIGETASGEIIRLVDASDMELESLRIFGKTIQDGTRTPTPDAPVPLETVGDSGSVTVKVGISETDENPQVLTISTPNSLPGLTANTVSNYTDENGQKWYCDEVDFEKGVYVQRIKQYVFNGDESWQSLSASTRAFYLKLDSRSYEYYGLILCDKLPYNGNVSDGVNRSVGIRAVRSSSRGGFCVYLRLPEEYADVTTVAKFKEWLSENPLTTYIDLPEPIEIPLTEEQLAQYATLHTNYPNTTIFNDGGAGMEAKYVADTKLYIDKKFAELAEAILNN